MKRPVEFGRGSAELIGKRAFPSGNRVYVSKCGAYRITSRKYSMPVASVGYVLDKLCAGEWVRLGHEHDSLADAKFAACCDKDADWEGV
jgi:hypothetical protein